MVENRPFLAFLTQWVMARHRPVKVMKESRYFIYDLESAFRRRLAHPANPESLLVQKLSANGVFSRSSLAEKLQHALWLGDDDVGGTGAERGADLIA